MGPTAANQTLETIVYLGKIIIADRLDDSKQLLSLDLLNFVDVCPQIKIQEGNNYSMIEAAKNNKEIIITNDTVTGNA